MKHQVTHPASEYPYTTTFYSVMEAEKFFARHIAHGAINEGGLHGTLTCQECNQVWEFDAARGAADFAQRKLSRDSYRDREAYVREQGDYFTDEADSRWW